jgi:hypothetical protein
LKPPGVTGLELFSHLRYKCAISPTAKVSPSCHLDVEVSNSQHKILQLTHKLRLTKREIMRDVAGKGGNMRLAARKLDSLGCIKAYSGLVNDEEKLTKWRNQVLLAKSIADIQAHDKAATLQKKASDASALVLLAADAREKLTAKNGDVSKITKKEICAILLAYYGTVVEETKHLKHVLVQMLSKLIDESPENIVVSPVAAVPGEAQMTELIDESPEDIVVSPVAAAPAGEAQTTELV